MIGRAFSRVLTALLSLVVANFVTTTGLTVARAQEKEKILYVAKQPKGAFNVSVMNPDGTGQTNLTRSDEGELDPCWSPDRKKIVFLVLDLSGLPLNGPWTDIWVMNTDGSGRVQLTKHEPKILAFAPAWSPDGKKIAYCSGLAGLSELFVVGADGKDRVRLGQGELPAWSPDGKSILYSRSMKGNRADPRLWLMGPDGKNVRVLSRDKATMGSWSPDGQRVAYVGDVEGSSGICVMNADGSEAKVVRKAGGNDAEWGPQWSANGKRLFFTGVRLATPPTMAIFVMDADGGNAKQLTDQKGQSFLGGGTARAGLSRKW